MVRLSHEFVYDAEEVHCKQNTSDYMENYSFIDLPTHGSNPLGTVPGQNDPVNTRN